MKHNSISTPLNFTVSEINGNSVISGGLVNDPCYFDGDDELMELAYQYCDEPAFRVHYTGFLLNVGDGDVDRPSADEIEEIRKLYSDSDPDFLDHLDFVESGSYSVSNPCWYDEEDC